MAADVHRPRVFLDVSISERPAGRITIELFADKTPKTCENFRKLCTGEHKGLSYATVPFHRIIDEFMIQGGDIARGNGTGTASIYDGEFPDEALNWREMDAPGLVCAANRGPDTNGSQFFITLEPCPHLNGKHTIFGRVVTGEDTVQRLAQVAVDKHDCPVEPVLVSRCGELERRRTKKQPVQQPPDSLTTSDPDERGRRRKSNDSDEEMENGVEAAAAAATTTAKAPATVTAAAAAPFHRRPRRQSDNIVDEGIRGRPRLRSGSRSRSPAIEEDDSGGDSHSGDDEPPRADRDSPARQPKRKRYPSPSRRGDSRERRRRSLPNQYADRYDRGYGDGDRYRPSPRRDAHRDYGRRRYDDSRYQSTRDRYQDDGRLNGDGRLGGGGGGSGYEDRAPPVKFKGRGAMKYREPERQW